MPFKGHPLDQFCETVVQGRILGVFTIYYLRDQNPLWIANLNTMVDGIAGLTIDKGDYAYMPVRAYEPGAKLPTDAPLPLDMAAEELGWTIHSRAGAILPGQPLRTGALAGQEADQLFPLPFQLL